MLPILGVLAVTIIIIVVDLPSLLRKKYKKEIWTFAIFLFFAVGLSMFWILHIPFPSPFVLLEIIYKPVNDAVIFLLT